MFLPKFFYSVNKVGGPKTDENKIINSIGNVRLERLKTIIGEKEK
jgi:hypothetical protein